MARWRRPPILTLRCLGVLWGTSVHLDGTVPVYPMNYHGAAFTSLCTGTMPHGDKIGGFSSAGQKGLGSRFRSGRKDVQRMRR